MGYTESGGKGIATTANESETFVLGAALGHAASPGLTVLLSGDLGAGKTVFAKGMAEGLGIDPAEVASPTFVLCREYAGRLPLYHFDLYRLSSEEDICEIGWDEYLTRQGVIVAEWPERLGSLTPEDSLVIVIAGDGDTRRVTAAAGGVVSQACLDAWRRAIGGNVL